MSTLLAELSQWTFLIHGNKHIDTQWNLKIFQVFINIDSQASYICDQTWPQPKPQLCIGFIYSCWSREFSKNSHSKRCKETIGLFPWSSGIRSIYRSLFFQSGLQWSRVAWLKKTTLMDLQKKWYVVFCLFACLFKKQNVFGFLLLCWTFYVFGRTCE